MNLYACYTSAVFCSPILYNLSLAEIRLTVAFFGVPALMGFDGVEAGIGSWEFLFIGAAVGEPEWLMGTLLDSSSLSLFVVSLINSEFPDEILKKIWKSPRWFQASASTWDGNSPVYCKKKTYYFIFYGHTQFYVQWCEIQNKRILSRMKKS